MSLGPVEIGLIVLAVMLLFGYKKLPDASRSLGRSLRIFKSGVDDLAGATTAGRGIDGRGITSDDAASHEVVPSAGGGSRTRTPEGTRS